jgi:hypothetical protein
MLQSTPLAAQQVRVHVHVWCHAHQNQRLQPYVHRVHTLTLVRFACVHSLYYVPG